MLVFVWIRALPGGPAVALLGGEERASPEAIAELERRLGADRPLHEQYARYVRDLARLDLGDSVVTGQRITEEFRRRLPATIELAVAGIALAVGLGVPLGVAAARARWLDRLSVVPSLLVISLPLFFLAFVLKYLFSVKLGWLPSVGRLSATREAAHPTGFYVLDALLAFDRATLADAIRHLVLPAVSLAAPTLAFIARVTRTAVLDLAQESFVRTAAAKGLTGWSVYVRHVLRLALLPVSTIVALVFAHLLAGSVLVENIFGWGGMGTLLQQAIPARDYAVMQATILFSALVFLVASVVADIGYTILDPRIRLEATPWP
jgi:peptide/nickel transport system permease protein